MQRCDEIVNLIEEERFLNGSDTNVVHMLKGQLLQELNMYTGCILTPKWTVKFGREPMGARLTSEPYFMLKV